MKYQYHLTNHFSVYGNFTTNYIPNYRFEQDYMGYFVFLGNASPFEKEYIHYYPDGDYYVYNNPKGHLVQMANYYFFDIGGSYTYAINQRNKLSAHLALSNAYGTNMYLYSEVYYHTGNETLHAHFGNKKADYWGAVAGLSYDYYFWRERMNVGATVNFRYYEKDMPFFVNYGPLIGFSF